MLGMLLSISKMLAVVIILGLRGSVLYAGTVQAPVSSAPDFPPPVVDDGVLCSHRAPARPDFVYVSFAEASFDPQLATASSFAVYPHRGTPRPVGASPVIVTASDDSDDRGGLVRFAVLSLLVITAVVLWFDAYKAGRSIEAHLCSPAGVGSGREVLSDEGVYSKVFQGYGAGIACVAFVFWILCLTGCTSVSRGSDESVLRHSGQLAEYQATVSYYLGRVDSCAERVGAIRDRAEGLGGEIERVIQLFDEYQRTVEQLLRDYSALRDAVEKAQGGSGLYNGSSSRPVDSKVLGLLSVRSRYTLASLVGDSLIESSPVEDSFIDKVSPDSSSFDGSGLEGFIFPALPDGSEAPGLDFAPDSPEGLSLAERLSRYPFPDDEVMFTRGVL